MPPSSPRGGRRRSSTWPAASVSRKCIPCRSGRARFAALARQRLLDPLPLRLAPLPPGAQRTGRRPRGADRGAEVEQRLGEVAGPRPGRGIRHEARGQRRQPRLRPRQRRRLGRQPRHHPLHIAVHRHHRLVEGDRRDRRGGIGADPRQRPQALHILGEAAACRHQPGAGMQVAGAGVVAKPGPFLHHRRLGGRRQRLHRRESRRGSGRSVARPRRPWSAAASPRTARPDKDRAGCPGCGRAARGGGGHTRQAAALRARRAAGLRREVRAYGQG